MLKQLFQNWVTRTKQTFLQSQPSDKSGGAVGGDGGKQGIHHTLHGSLAQYFQHLRRAAGVAAEVQAEQRAGPTRGRSAGVHEPCHAFVITAIVAYIQPNEPLIFFQQLTKSFATKRSKSIATEI